MPALLLGGELSPAAFSEVLDRLESTLPDVRRHRFPRAGHLMHVQRAREFVRVLEDFASELSARG